MASSRAGDACVLRMRGRPVPKFCQLRRDQGLECAPCEIHSEAPACGIGPNIAARTYCARMWDV